MSFRPLSRRSFIAATLGAAGLGTFAIGYSTSKLFENEAFSWQPLTSRNNGPSARLNPSLTYDQKSDQLIVFGGSGQGGYLDDIWTYDFESNWWTELTSRTDGPEARSNATAQYDQDQDCMVVFGGQGHMAYDDVWAYDNAKQAWVKQSDVDVGQVQYEVSMENHPHPRVDYAEAYHAAAQRVLISGGSQELTRLYNDVWSFDLTSQRWNELYIIGEQPEARDRHRAVWVPGRGLVVFGGLGQTPLNDLWLLEMV